MRYIFIEYSLRKIITLSVYYLDLYTDTSFWFLFVWNKYFTINTRLWHKIHVKLIMLNIIILCIKSFKLILFRVIIVFFLRIRCIFIRTCAENVNNSIFWHASLTYAFADINWYCWQIQFYWFISTQHSKLLKMINFSDTFFVYSLSQSTYR